MKKSNLLRNAAAAVALTAAVLAGVSCNRNKRTSAAEQTAATEKFKIEKVGNFKANGLTSCEVELVVTNSTRHAVTLGQGSRIDLYYAGAKLGSILSDADVEVPKRATSTVTLPMSLTIDNPLAIYAAYGKLQRGETDKFTLSLNAAVKTAGVKRTIERNNIPLSTVLSMFGADASGLKNLLNF